MNGWVKIFRSTSRATTLVGRLRSPPTAIISGAMTKCRMLSKQKISATGTAAAGPKAAIAIPGPI